jgi:hypothetical protein
MSLIKAVLKVPVRQLFLLHSVIYSVSGILKNRQNFFINLLPMLSILGADFMLQVRTALSSSSVVMSRSSVLLSSRSSLLDKMTEWLHKSPRKSSTQLSKLTGAASGI